MEIVFTITTFIFLATTSYFYYKYNNADELRKQYKYLYERSNILIKQLNKEIFEYGHNQGHKKKV